MFSVIFSHILMWYVTFMIDGNILCVIIFVLVSDFKYVKFTGASSLDAIVCGLAFSHL